MNKKEIFIISNLLSFLRLILAVPLFFMMENYFNGMNQILFLSIGIVAALSDSLDGYFARKFNQITEIGKILDPLADKICVGLIVLKLFLLNKIDLFIFVLIIGRDVIIIIVGMILAKKLGNVMPSNKFGKITVTIIAIFLFVIVIQIPSVSAIYKTFYVLTISFIFVSLISYGIRTLEILGKKK
ncbi:MAG: CDP-alcohol phosphatidyltransferase family protein [Ignavibacterium sp.]